MDSCTVALKYEPEFASFVLSPMGVRGGSRGPVDQLRIGDNKLVVLPMRFRYTASSWMEICPSTTGMGRGTEQHESTMILGRPVIMLRVRSSEYRLHHVRINVSRFTTVAEGSSFRTWRPRVYANRTATPMIVHALLCRQRQSKKPVAVDLAYRLTCPTDSQ